MLHVRDIIHTHVHVVHMYIVLCTDLLSCQRAPSAAVNIGTGVNGPDISVQRCPCETDKYTSALNMHMYFSTSGIHVMLWVYGRALLPPFPHASRGRSELQGEGAHRNLRQQAPAMSADVHVCGPY